MRRSWPSILLAALIVQIPFEFRREVLSLSNLQWTFVALVLVSAPSILRNWRDLLRRRLIQAGLIFAAVQWLAAVFAPEFQSNAIKAAVRFSAGLVLLTISSVTYRKHSYLLNRIWTVAAAGAVLYSLASYVGFGLPWLFRNEEFYIGQIQRLSGSFEYPNTAAAYFAMSLPVVWWSSVRPWLKSAITFLLWCAVVLTFSRGALLAVPMAIAAGLVLAHRTENYWRSTVVLVVLGIASYVVLLPWNPYWLERLYGAGVRNPIQAEYKTAWNYLLQQPNSTDRIQIEVRNAGIKTWRSAGVLRDAIAYRWWNTATEVFVPADTIVTALPGDVRRGETVQVTAEFKTPSEPGKYLLVMELFSGAYDWWSRKGVVPALIEVDVRRGAARVTNVIDLYTFYHRGRSPRMVTATVPRSDLWKAALKMILEHPFGVGPDNYRLEYGRYLGASSWDVHVYSNNLFLEILTGSGLLGVAAFIWLLICVRWQFDAGSLAIGVFLVHGLVDVFLMTTPIYFAFWLLLGKHEDRNPG